MGATTARLTRSRGRGDRVLSGLTGGAGLAVLVLIVAIAVFLTDRAIPALRADTTNFLTTRIWNPDETPATFGVLATSFGTILTSALALLIAGPLAVGIALYVSEYAPVRLARPLGSLIDLLAAIPSVVYGLWGLNFLVPYSGKFQGWLAAHLGFIPLFSLGKGGVVGRSIFIASIVLAIMILPIIAAVTREVFLQVPRPAKEAALALGATKLEMIRYAVLPHSRSGITGALMLGLGRALGETIAVALVLSLSSNTSFHILNANDGGNTIAANIAAQYQAAEPTGQAALIASGLVLFVITFAVNAVARVVVARGNRRVAGR
ncbi:MAG: phosphate ABC transporter permease subunit PstC [Actinomycetota bacterium]|nr:phosphate ABC transporter permease subunit PstC [Actinomycetota bacterium]